MLRLTQWGRRRCAGAPRLRYVGEPTSSDPSAGIVGTPNTHFYGILGASPAASHDEIKDGLDSPPQVLGLPCG